MVSEGYLFRLLCWICNSKLLFWWLFKPSLIFNQGTLTRLIYHHFPMKMWQKFWISDEAHFGSAWKMKNRFCRRKVWLERLLRAITKKQTYKSQTNKEKVRLWKEELVLKTFFCLWLHFFKSLAGPDGKEVVCSAIRWLLWNMFTFY